MVAPIPSNHKPEVAAQGVFSIRVCVPDDWNDEQIKEFADRAVICGTSGGWFVCKKGSTALGGDPDRVPCNDKPGFVHVVLEA